MERVRSAQVVIGVLVLAVYLKPGGGYNATMFIIISYLLKVAMFVGVALIFGLPALVAIVSGDWTSPAIWEPVLFVVFAFTACVIVLNLFGAAKPRKK